MKKTSEAKAIALDAPQAKTLDTRAFSLMAAIVVGAAMLFVSGYAQATVLHDTAHDQRHALAFPCH